MSNAAAGALSCSPLKSGLKVKPRRRISKLPREDFFEALEKSVGLPLSGRKYPLSARYYSNEDLAENKFRDSFREKRFRDSLRNSERLSGLPQLNESEQEEKQSLETSDTHEKSQRDSNSISCSMGPSPSLSPRCGIVEQKQHKKQEESGLPPMSPLSAKRLGPRIQSRTSIISVESSVMDQLDSDKAETGAPSKIFFCGDSPLSSPKDMPSKQVPALEMHTDGPHCMRRRKRLVLNPRSRSQSTSASSVNGLSQKTAPMVLNTKSNTVQEETAYNGETAKGLSYIAQSLAADAGNTFAAPDMTEVVTRVSPPRSRQSVSSSHCRSRQSVSQSSMPSEGRPRTSSRLSATFLSARASFNIRKGVRALSPHSSARSSLFTGRESCRKNSTSETKNLMRKDKDSSEDSVSMDGAMLNSPPNRGSPPPLDPQTSKLFSTMDALRQTMDTGDLYLTSMNLLSTGKTELPFFIHPHDHKKVSWDLFCALLVVYSVVDIPLRLTFEFTHNYWDFVVESFIDLCFIVDISVSFFTAYFQEGKLIVDRRLIGRHYLSSWFLLDFASSVPFDSILSLIHTGSPFLEFDNYRSFKLVKAVRPVIVLRMLRLLRIIKLFQKIKVVQTGKVSSVMTPAMLTLVMRMLCILFFAHLFACGWHVITGCSNPDLRYEIGWKFCGYFDSTASQYLASIYWVIATMMGVGYGEIYATSMNERGYALVVMISGSVASGMIITSVSMLVSKIKPYKNEYSNRMNEIKEYMLERRLPTKLQSKLRRHFTYVYRKVSVFDETSIHSYLTPHLYQQLVLNKHQPLIKKLQFFEKTLEISLDFVCSALQKLKPMQAQVGEDIMVQGDFSEEMYFLTSGQVNALRFNSRNETPTLIAIYREGHEFGLESLVLHQDLPVTYRAMTTCDTFFLDQNDYDDMVNDFPEIAEFIFLRVKGIVGNMRKSLSAGVDDVDGVRCRQSIVLGLELVPVSLVEINPIKQRRSTIIKTKSGEDLLNKGRLIRVLKKGVLAVYDENIKKVIDQHIKYEEDMYSDVFSERKLIDPEGNAKNLWDVWIGLLTVYSVIQLPVMIGFDITHPFLITLWLFVDVAFLIDIVITFRTALELSPNLYAIESKEIAQTYLKTWFIFDLLSSIPWELLASSGMKMIRIVRVGKFMKLFRIIRFFKKLEELLLGSGINTYLEHSILLTVTLSFIGHMFGCFFHFMAISGSDDSWTEADGLGTLTERYCASIYWAFTTMTTVGYGDITPQSDAERAFVTVVMFLGATTFGYIVGTVSSLMSQMNHAKQYGPELVSMVSDYLNEQHVEFNLTQSIKRHLQHVFEIRSAFDEASLLSKMPRHLRRATLLFVRRDVIRSFDIFEGQSRAFAAYIAGHMEPMFCPTSNFIYTSGDENGSIYFLIDGIVEIVQTVDLPTKKPKKGNSLHHYYYNDNTGDVLKRIVENGGIFGHEAYLGREPQLEGARAFVDCCLFVLPKEEVIFMNERYRSLAEKLKSTLLEYHRKVIDKGFDFGEVVAGFKDTQHGALTGRRRSPQSNPKRGKLLGQVTKLVSKAHKKKMQRGYLRERSFVSSRLSFYNKSLDRSDLKLQSFEHLNKQEKKKSHSKSTKIYLAPESSPSEFSIHDSKSMEGKEA